MKHRFPDHLASARLRLRRLQRDDAEALCAYRSLPEVARYQSWDSFGPDDAARLIESQLTAEPDIPGTWFQLAIVEAATGDFIGDCGLHCRKEDSRQMEIGITLSPRHQGRRYAAEAVECLLDYLFGSLRQASGVRVHRCPQSPGSGTFSAVGFSAGGAFGRASVVQGPVGERIPVRDAEA